MKKEAKFMSVEFFFRMKEKKKKDTNIQLILENSLLEN
jgi:hypothetical protein